MEYFTIEDLSTGRYFYKVLRSEVPDRVADLVMGDQDLADAWDYLLVAIGDFCWTWNMGYSTKSIERELNIRVWDPTKE